MSTLIKASTTGPYKVLGDFLRNNPNHVITKVPEIFEYTINHSSAHPEVRHLQLNRQL